jgi:hypothetical protein
MADLQRQVLVRTHERNASRTMSRPNDGWGITWYRRGKEYKLEGASALILVTLLFALLVAGMASTLVLAIATIMHLLEGIGGP